MTKARVHMGTLVGLAVVIGAASFLVFRQPLSAPWWFYADADATYASSALNVAVGRHINYLDHPGLPETEILALSFEAESLPSGGPNRGWAGAVMLNLDRARLIVRGWAILFFIGGAATAFALLRRLFGHWTWGAAGGLLWLAQPELPDVMQIRPDVLVSLLGLTAGFVVIRAAERRSPLWLLFGAILVGIGLMVKVNAAALLIPVLLASVVCYPGDGWPARLRTELRSWLPRHRSSLGIAAGLWIAVALVLNLRAPPRYPSGWRVDLVTECVGGGLVYLLAGLVVRLWTSNRIARRIFDPLFPLLAVALALGVFIPVGLFYGDGLRAVGSAAGTLFGGNVNNGIKPFSTSLFPRLLHYPLALPALVFLAAALAALWGIRRRTAWPVIWFSGALAAGVMAAARLDTSRYFALPYVLSIPPALWLFRRAGKTAMPLAAWALVAFAIAPTFLHSHDDAASAAQQERIASATERLGNRLLKPGEAAIVPDVSPLPDARWFDFVEIFTNWHPAYPYRFLADTSGVRGIVQAYHLRVRYFIGPMPQSSGPVRLTTALGTYEATPVPGSTDPATGIGALRLTSGFGT